MTTSTPVHPLVASDPMPASRELPASLLDELRSLAMAHDSLSARSRQLYEQLRKMIGQERLVDCLVGIQTLAQSDDVAGARMLATFIDAQTPGSQLVPQVRHFRSVHRLLVGDTELVGGIFLQEWQERVEEHIAACRGLLGADAPTSPATHRTPPLQRPPLPLFRATVDRLVSQTATTEVPRDQLTLLAGLVRLECDAYQERVSRLASTIDPYRVAAVMRTLPLLNRADAEIRDLHQFALWLEAGDLESAFRRRVSREYEILDEKERPRLAAALTGEPELAPLAAIRAGFVKDPPPFRDIAGPAARLLVLGRALERHGLRDRPLSLLEAVQLVLTHRRDGRFELELPADLAVAVGKLLMSGPSSGADDLRSFELNGCRLRVVEPRLGLGDRVWRHDLPTLAEMASGAEDVPESESLDEKSEGAEDDDSRRDDDTSVSAIKQMVLNNVGSVSILLGFLRNQKVTSIPGLVGDVTRRTRAGRVLEVIASDRNLYTGHANKDVPRALLESPVNVSIKMLRRFVHVKYVSKTDLRRMAKDKARLRKEVCREIESYLDSLG